nr:VOC family protein [Phytoactinopolyspora mesophila]
MLRSMDMPLREIRRMISGAGEAERRRIFQDHRARLEGRVEEVRGLLDAVDAMTEENPMSAETCVSSWLHVMPRLPVADMERSLAYYQEALGFRLDWRMPSGQVAMMANGQIEMLMLMQWAGGGAPPTQSAYVYVEDPDALCAEYQQAGADIVESVATRSYGMRDFIVRDPDGHTFTLGRGTDKLRDVADQYGVPADAISVDPNWLEQRKPRP